MPSGGAAGAYGRATSATVVSSRAGRIRRGLAELDGEGEVVGGIVIMRYGENALDVIDAVKARLAEVEQDSARGRRARRHLRPLGPDSRVDRDAEAHADRGDDRRRLIIFVFLLHVRSALVPILTLPLGVLLAFIPMYYQGLTANIMSLGGIAVAIGAMVDASIIIIENIHKKLEDWERAGRPGAAHERHRRSDAGGRAARSSSRCS